ncbi:OLC1v1013028C2 [Oldenlandia corymbosa var. corymbosa]|uniref:OLC1v1013028C2 n=1 Tax=Oldenlandia corymbosa var. corymbosa TaxID=529605 RepID=A0AAV1DZ88_OLDCO|nr:OLC1v1013028C2 [Oldenlandia corymbosa var. corymbosa]
MCLIHSLSYCSMQSILWFFSLLKRTSICLLQDGRKISVGDCALFKAPQDSPPSIGIIRCLRSCGENNLQLGVNWLYRPVELQLGKGLRLDATPNEIFYSFNEDEIPAASLLHPCKVAFLPKGIELPSGTSSFVCRRVYDVEKKCLRWLTDQDYIDERQEEVDKLLLDTRLEMDASFQSGNHSPKMTNNSLSGSQLKQGPDSGQGSIGSVHSQTKAKKRERGDQSFDHPVKRERSLRSEDTDSGMYKHESSLRSEIAKMKDRGGLVDSESVEKLVQLMQVDKVDKKIDLASCSILAGVIAATDKFDCLNRFIQLKGLPVFDEWLQDVHKGKIGDASSLKDGDKSVEDFLLVLLRALDKLPVNLHALQTCNIGRSVNHLRSHKNLEIQKKARSLVDTWKKRVEAEMNATDGKIGSPQASWSTKSRPSEAQGGKSSGGSCDIASKGVALQVPTSKVTSAKVSQVEPAGRCASPSPGPLKSASSPASIKEAKLVAGSVSDPPLSVKEEKSSSSSQSLSVKDDARSSPVASVSINRISSSSRYRKSINGFPGSLPSGGSKETGSGRNSSTQRNAAPEKLQSASLTDKASEVPPVEGSTHKLIVKIPKRGRSPSQSISGGSVEETFVTSSRASSPVLSDKHEPSERNVKEKGDASRKNFSSDGSAESWQSTDFKDLQAGNDEGHGSPATLREEERSRIAEDARKVPGVSKAVPLPSGKLHDASFSPMNALIESCVKYSEANSSMSLADDVGMNLLATVAAGEICRSDSLASTEPLHGDTAVEGSTGEDVSLKSAAAESISQNHPEIKPVDCDGVEQGTLTGLLSKDGSDLSKQVSAKSTGDREAPDLSEATLQKTTNFPTCTSGRLDDNGVSNSPIPPTGAKNRDGDPIKQPDRMDTDVSLKNVSEGTNNVDIPVCTSSSMSENKDEPGRMNTSVFVEQKPAMLAEADFCPDTGHAKESVSGNVDEIKVREVDSHHGSNSANHSEGGTVAAKTCNVVAPPVDKETPGLCSESVEQTSGCSIAKAEKKEAADPHSSCAQKESPSKDVIRNMDLREPVKPDAEADERADWGSADADFKPVRSANEPEMDSKVSFDLNEGLMGDDGKYGESFNSVNHGCVPVRVFNPACSAVVSSCIPTSVTVTAAAKGGFVPPVDLLRSKGELGWKGSAATSAFRPAEPRKVLQLPLNSFNNSTADESTSKPGRAALDIDLNVPDERVLEDMGFLDSNAPVHFSNNNQLQRELGPVTGRSSGGLDLDLNRVDDTNDMLLQSSVSSIRRLEIAPAVSLKPSPSSLLPNSGIRNDFDLNGPSFEDAAAELPSSTHGRTSSQSNTQPAAELPSSTHGRTSSQSNTQPATPGVRPSNLEAGNFSAWFSPGTSYSSITIPSPLPDRAEQPFPIIPAGATQRILGPPGGNPFTTDVFRGSVLTSPAVPFTPNPFTYQMVPFGTTLPLASASFSVGSTSFVDATTGGRIYTPVNTQFLGPVSAVSSQYPRPYMVSLSDNNNGVLENGRKWSRQGLDLNTGPGVSDIEGREETLVQRQLAIGSSQALAEEPVRMFPLSGGVLKRKDPEGGWNGDNLRFKESSWP